MLLFWTKLFNARCLNVPILARIYLALGVIFQSFKLSSPFVDWFDAQNKFLRRERISNYVRASCVVCSVKFIWCDHRLTVHDHCSGLVLFFMRVEFLKLHYRDDVENYFQKNEHFSVQGCFKWLTARLRTYPKAPKLNLHTYRAHVPFHSGRVSTAMIREC
ncbi:hypothetical protein T03_11357 [Trichinella britovi]|uniref:Uncharacterized protein n=1 Tax=Trichinella britovi TaxID=45882 RepID=A0A0V1D1J4_TRIBR|nr:hypothetical protein T03_11357 [Trichinella britovi]